MQFNNHQGESMKKLILLPLILVGCTVSASDLYKGFKKFTKVGQSAYEKGKEAYKGQKEKYEAVKKGASESGKTLSSSEKLLEKAKGAGRTLLGSAKGATTRYDELKEKERLKKEAKAGSKASSKEASAAEEAASDE